MSLKQKALYSEEYVNSFFSSGYMGRLEEAVLTHFNADSNMLRLPENLSMHGHELYFWSLNGEPDIKSEAERGKIVQETISKIEYLSSWRAATYPLNEPSEDDLKNSMYITCIFAAGMLNERMEYFYTAASLYITAASLCAKCGNLERAFNFVNHAEFLYNLWEDEKNGLVRPDFEDEIKHIRKTIIGKMEKRQ